MQPETQAELARKSYRFEIFRRPDGTWSGHEWEPQENCYSCVKISGDETIWSLMDRICDLIIEDHQSRIEEAPQD